MSTPAKQFLSNDGNINSGENTVAENEEGVTSSLADLIVGFDVSPYLSEPLREIWHFLQDYPILFAIVLITMGYGLGRLLKSWIHWLLDRFRKSTKSEIDYQIAHYLTSPVLQTTVTFSLVLALATLDFPGAIEHLLIKLCITALLIFWGRAWFRATKVILQALEADRDRFKLFQPRTIPLYEMGIKLLLTGLFIYLFFLVWGIDATAWVASAGIIGIAIGFASRDTLANLISGVSIVADAPYKIGDYIVLDTGERGVVSNLGIRSTRLITRDDVEVSIPNAVIGTAKIVNESGGPYVRHRIRIPIGVAYDSDIDNVIETLEALAAENEKVVNEPPPRIRIRGFGDSAINLELLCWIRRPAERGLVLHELNYQLIKRFREEGIEIPFPQQDLHVRDLPPGSHPAPE
ncbi:MAG: mechanosensitive ion channel family protein [Xanthomonadales bacterium]|nr:mechanosensitive ion channel family protein [Gammaproteobacteria bacterium]NND57920.1 mechanosensitive ion channel family protein [Xanthomonadales bacterium]NNK50800.1 mechanosensitive ion channel family protein [Xanthomonadales bacterium]